MANSPMSHYEYCTKRRHLVFAISAINKKIAAVIKGDATELSRNGLDLLYKALYESQESLRQLDEQWQHQQI